MPTAPSSTESTPVTTPARVGQVAAARRAVQDVGILLHFRRQAIRRRHVARILVLVFVGITLATTTVPSLMPGAGGPGKAFDILLLMPSAMAAVLLLNMLSAVASGGGRELISRDQAGPHPVSPTTDHLGALLLTPFNISWMVQAWILLGSMAYGLGPGKLVTAQVGILLWLVFSTSVGQVVAWSMEALRRSRHGITLTRGLLAAGAFGALAVQLTGNTTNALDQVPTVPVFVGFISGWSVRWLVTVLALAAAALVAVAVGAVPAHVAAKRMPRDEARMETDQHEPRRISRTLFGTLVRVDRGSVWRSVPMRRGMMVLAVGPGLVAIFGDLPWSTMTILPGLVASGGALLFGVNAWSLDGRGALWRESLPVSPGLVFEARAWVIAEFLAVAALITLGLGALRAGIPDVSESAALVCTMVVVLLQVVGAAMRWSLGHPYPVDMRSARATPAPPAAMVGYSARLAVSTTFTGLCFSACAQVPNWHLSVIIAIPCVLWSGTRFARTSRRWDDPMLRARVVTTTAA